jgi:hypothetical protein
MYLEVSSHRLWTTLRVAILTWTFMVPLRRKLGTKILGESRSQAVCRYIAFECSLTIGISF